MSKESSPSSHQAPSVINQNDGSINEAALAKQYGLGVTEAKQKVTFGNYTGTVAQMLDDGRCPVGGMVRNAYQEHGIDGVVKQFSLLKMMDPKFEVTVTEETIERDQKKNRQNQIFPQQNL
jgi:hypothetical protein